MQAYITFPGYLALMAPTWKQLYFETNYLKACAMLKDTRKAFALANIKDEPEILFDGDRNCYSIVVLTTAYEEYIKKTS